MKRHVTPGAVAFRIGLVVIVAATALAGVLFVQGLRRQPQERVAAQPTLPAVTQPPETLPPETVPTETLPPETTAPPETTEPQPVVSTVTLVAVGDNLIHNMVFRSGWGTDPWNYDHLYQYVKDDIQAADLAAIDEETIFVEKHENVSHYPRFGTPTEIGDAVVKAGFDVILHASNHVMDQGIDNVYFSLDYWSDKPVTVLGIHKDAEDAKLPKIVEKNGIRLGMINYTYSTNGIPVPSDQKYAVDMLDDVDKLLADVAYLEEHADITVAFLHQGAEYSVKPSQEALRVVEKVVAAGADLLIDGHPHVLEPYERYTAENGNTAVVYHSLGNFVSAQTELDRLLGGMAKVTIQKTEFQGESKTEVTDFTLVPIVTHTAFDDSYAVYKLEDYTDELARKNVLVPTTTQRLWDRFYQIVGKPEEEN